MRGLINLLSTSKSSELLILAMTTLGQILNEGDKMVQMGARANVYLLMLESEGGIKVVEKLQHHPDDKVYKVVDELINSYFFTEQQ